MTDDVHIVRTAGLDWSQVWRGKHPFNPASEMRLFPLSTPTGMTRVGVSLIRIPPGKESFIPHAHALQEEFVFILEGVAELTLDSVVHPMGPGDFAGFPTDGVVHSLKAVGPDDLVYLTGGERGPTEIAEMPTIGRTMVMRGDRITMYDRTGAEEVSQEAWFARARIDD